MPFKLKLKKSQQKYIVASKSTYVITVELLDNTLLECTLSAESTGRDCMNNVCQRLNLAQPDLFGLRYISRRSYPKIRWVDLDRPLKKQLDKYALEPYLYLSVMFYVNDVSLLEDEVTRYHYFLQLKLDVIEGRLRCNYEQAIVLASYSLQAEFGDHDPEKHTLEYLQDFPLLPKPILQQFPEEKLSTLTDAIITQHSQLRGIAQQLAEVYYIVGAQQLDGYGQECFLAKDETGNEVLIGASLTGIVVRKGPNASSPQFFKWNDITNLVNHRRCFGIECQNYEYSAQFLLEEADSAKYVWKMCVLQHTFYKMHASATESNELSIKLGNNPNTPHPSQRINQYDRMPYPTTIQHSEIQSFHQQTQMVDISPMKLQTSSGSPPKQMVLLEQSSSAYDHGNNTTIQASFNNYVLSQSTNSVNEMNQSVSNPDFRPVPDYETAIRNKYGMAASAGLGQGQRPFRTSQQQLQHLVQPQKHYQGQNNLSAMYSSQPSLVTDSTPLQVPVENHYQNNPAILLNHQNHNAYSSTPELNRINLSHQVHAMGDVVNNNEQSIMAEIQRMHAYKPPPPYPYARNASSSTPDLAGVNGGHQLVGIGGSSPDLVSRRNLGGRADRGKLDQLGSVHKTMENLHDLSDYRNAYSTEELNSAVVYGLQSGKTQGQEGQQSGQGKQSFDEPIYQNTEPIYQNLPAHEVESFQAQDLDSSANDSIHIDETVDTADPVQNTIQKSNNASVTVTSANATSQQTNRLQGHVSRVAITNSRENLLPVEVSVSQQDSQVRPHGSPKRSVTKISLGEVDQAREPITLTRQDSDPKPELNYVPEPPTPEVLKETSHQHQPRTPGQKPRAGRKRWALNFASKTGSLKSIKSEGGSSHKSQDSLDGSASMSKASGFGPMMLATLQGLTRSRPDLLNDTLTTFARPSKMPKEEIGAYLETKLMDGEVLREFEQIPKKKLQNCHFNTAMMAENLVRSRFKDVLPYEENRVKLSSVDKENRTGFINASHVSATVGPDQRFYIAAQGPLPNTVLHFWQMIFQCDVHLIVMLTESETGPQAKTSNCIPYWPHKKGSTIELGDFKITKKFTSDTGGDSYTTSTLLVTHLPTKKSRTIWHLQYSDWVDHGCPSNVKKYIEFLEEMAALREHTATEIPVGRNRNPPVLIHCSAGVGRTGVTILCDILLYCVDHNLDIDIPKVLTHLRQQRMMMVQTIAQYKFVHTVLINYLKQSRLI